MRHSEICLQIITGGFEAVKAAKPGPYVDKLKCALQSVMDMLKRLRTVCEGRAMVALVNGKMKNYKGLPESMHSVAHCLQVNWDKEIDSVKEEEVSDVQPFIAKFDMAEAACAAVVAPPLSDSIFDSVREKCKTYFQTFVKSCRLTMDQQGNAFYGPLHSFTEKYQELEAAVEAWTLKDVEWMFINDTTEEVKRDMEGLKVAAKQAMEFLKALDGIIKYEKICFHLTQL